MYVIQDGVVFLKAPGCGLAPVIKKASGQCFALPSGSSVEDAKKIVAGKPGSALAAMADVAADFLASHEATEEQWAAELEK